MTNLNDKKYMTVSDLKKYLCISTTAAYELTHRKDFPVCRFGSAIRIPTDLFLKWVELKTNVPRELQSFERKENMYV